MRLNPARPYRPATMSGARWARGRLLRRLSTRRLFSRLRGEPERKGWLSRLVSFCCCHVYNAWRLFVNWRVS